VNSPSEPPTRLDILEATARVPEHVVYRSFQAETLLLNLQTGRYHGVNGTGGRLLELLEPSQGRLAPAVAALAEEYGVSFDEIASDLATFCSELEERGLVELTRRPGGEQVV
jgi:DNA-binding transcriptional regulator GbsR (MarR family)